jgi:hypothetical protein
MGMPTLSQEGAYIMDSLTTDPVAAVLKRLFQEAESADRPLLERFRDKGRARDEMAKFFAAEAKDYKTLYRQYADNFLNVSADFGRFLYMCARVRAHGSLAAHHAVTPNGPSGPGSRAPHTQTAGFAGDLCSSL